MEPVPIYLNVQEIASYLGIGRNRALQLCQNRPHKFPVVRVGRRYQADSVLLEKWRAEWFSGEFEID